MKDRFIEKLAKADAINARLQLLPTGASPRAYSAPRSDGQTWSELKKINDGLRCTPEVPQELT